LSIPGTSTLGSVNITTLNADNVVFDSFSLVGGGETSFTLESQTTDTVSLGSTIIPVLSFDSVQTGDYISIGTFFNKRGINGLIGSTSITPFDENTETRSVSYDVGAGSTIVFLNSTANISVGNSITFAGIGSYIPIVGLATTAVGTLNVDNVFVAISGDVSAGSTIVGLSTLTGIAIGHSFSNSSGTREYIPIVGFGTTTIDVYNVLTLNTSVYEEIAANAEFIPVSLETVSGLSTQVSVGNSITVNNSDFGEDVNDTRLVLCFLEKTRFLVCLLQCRLFDNCQNHCRYR